MLIEFLRRILSIKALENQIISLEQRLTPKKIQEIKDPSLKTSPDERFSIRIEKSHKDWVSIHTSLPMITDQKIANYYSYEFPQTFDKVLRNPCPAILEEFLDAIFETKRCIAVSFTPFQVSIQKTPAVSWDDILPKFEEMTFDFLNKKYPVIEAESEAVEAE